MQESVLNFRFFPEDEISLMMASLSNSLMEAVTDFTERIFPSGLIVLSWRYPRHLIGSNFALPAGFFADLISSKMQNPETI